MFELVSQSKFVDREIKAHESNDVCEEVRRSSQTSSSIKERALGDSSHPGKSRQVPRTRYTNREDERCGECLPFASARRKSRVNSPPFTRGRVGAPAAATAAV